jgi:hypothetical protein
MNNKQNLKWGHVSFFSYIIRVDLQILGEIFPKFPAEQNGHKDTLNALDRLAHLQLANGDLESAEGNTRMALSRLDSRSQAVGWGYGNWLVYR